jgi:hypothetical protein
MNYARKPLSRSICCAMLGLLGFSACESTAGPTERAAVEVWIAEDSISLETNDSSRLIAAVRDAKGRELQTPQLNWVVRDTAIARISADGWLLARDAGQTRAIATYRGANGLTLSDSVLVTVAHRLQLVLTSHATGLKYWPVGRPLRLSIIVTRGQVAVAGAEVSLSVVEGGATLDSTRVRTDQYGHAFATMRPGVSGPSTIAATIGRARSQWTVNSAPLPPVQLSPDSLVVKPGSPFAYSSVYADVPGGSISGLLTVSFASTDTTIVTVVECDRCGNNGIRGGVGHVYAKGVGRALVIATHSTRSDTIPVRVVPDK